MPKFQRPGPLTSPHHPLLEQLYPEGFDLVLAYHLMCQPAASPLSLLVCLWLLAVALLAMGGHPLFAELKRSGCSTVTQRAFAAAAAGFAV